jgi:predicted DNA-binding WGR domain protein
MSNPCYLQKRRPEKNEQRFYCIHVCQGVFGDWSVVREWGRIGSPGTVRSVWFNLEADAVAAADQWRLKKMKGGYRPPA